MTESWSAIVRNYRLRHSLTQSRLGLMLGVSQRTVSRWERGQDTPSLTLQKRLRDLSRSPDSLLAKRLFAAVENCPAPRALSRFPSLRLLALSPAAIRKRPTITEWIGHDLTRIASGVLAEMLDDQILQKSIANGEIACVRTTTRSVLRTVEAPSIQTYRTTITYFLQDGTLYSDAVSMPGLPDDECGYTPVPMDTVTGS
ncbi:MAG: helix-turn-helix transcriptional regulator [Rhodomicrobiaceae bacterium]